MKMIINSHIFRQIPVIKKIVFNLLKSKNPITISDLNFKTKFSNSYALISEKKSVNFQRIINRLKCYFGSGYIGPNKMWEYPWVISNLRLKKGMKILDVGCGTSPIQYLLSDCGIKVYGIDPYEYVKWHGIDRKLAKFFRCKIEYRIESGDNISYNDNTFDRVCSVSVIEHIRAEKVENPQKTPFTEDDMTLQKKMMQEMIRVLKPRGICVVTIDFNLPRNNILPESNVNLPNLMNIKGTKILGDRIDIAFYGEPNFNYIDLIKDSDIDISSYNDKLQLSIGFTLQKL